MNSNLKSTKDLRIFKAPQDFDLQFLALLSLLKKENISFHYKDKNLEALTQEVYAFQKIREEIAISRTQMELKLQEYNILQRNLYGIFRSIKAYGMALTHEDPLLKIAMESFKRPNKRKKKVATDATKTSEEKITDSGANVVQLQSVDTNIGFKRHLCLKFLCMRDMLETENKTQKRLVQYKKTSCMSLFLFVEQKKPFFQHFLDKLESFKPVREDQKLVREDQKPFHYLINPKT